MAVEIERKFLVDMEAFSKSVYFKDDFAKVDIEQGYLFNCKGKTLRVRNTSGGPSYLTYKGPSKGISRTEIEFRIPKVVGKLLSKMCGSVIRKTRLTFPTVEAIIGLNETVWEMDTFNNLGYPLVIAELEVPSEDYIFAKPGWLGIEVSDDPRYYNSNLIEGTI